MLVCWLSWGCFCFLVLVLVLMLVLGQDEVLAGSYFLQLASCGMRGEG
jgi:hypothetical protein